MATTTTDAKSTIEGKTILSDVPISLERYRFNREVAGKCLIINNRCFDEGLTGQLERDGTEVDGNMIETTFQQLGFDVDVRNNLKTLEMRFALAEIARQDHSNYDCFVCFILSHGDKDEAIYGYDGRINLHDLIDKVKGFNCPTLIGKPKLFFVQACRGRKYDFGTDVIDGLQEEEEMTKRISFEADLMIAYSVVPGYFSWRNNVDGSWFIQSLCHVLNSNLVSTTDLLSLLTVVCRLVSEKFESATNDSQTSGLKQVPWIVSTLTKLVYFSRK